VTVTAVVPWSELPLAVTAGQAAEISHHSPAEVSMICIAAPAWSSLHPCENRR
jgi:hypothetical protein